MIRLHTIVHAGYRGVLRCPACWTAVLSTVVAHPLDLSMTPSELVAGQDFRAVGCFENRRRGAASKAPARPVLMSGGHMCVLLLLC